MLRAEFALSSLLSARSRLRPELVICPFGGASLASFRRWALLPRNDVTISLVTYPGRDRRIEEPLAASVQALAFELAGALAARPLCGAQIVLGHSLGAQVAFETCHQLVSLGRTPDALVLSGCQAPHLTARRVFGSLSDDALVRALVEAGGCPPEFERDAELRAFYVPILRHDFVISEAYRRELGQLSKLQLPVLLLWGDADPEATGGDVEAWQAWFSGRVERTCMTGDHFYIAQQPTDVFQELLRVFPALFS